MRPTGTMSVGDGLVMVAEEPPCAPDDDEAARPWGAPPPGEQFEVLFVAAGERAAQYVRALRQHRCARPDPGAGFAGARVVTLEAGRPATPSGAEQPRVRDDLHDRLAAAFLVVFVVSVDGPWDAALAGADPLLSAVEGARLLVVDLRDESRSLAHGAGPRAGEHKGLVMGRDALASGPAGNERLESAPAAILSALFQPGFVCIDYERYLEVQGGGPGVAAAGFGRAEPGTALASALDAAYAAWRANSAGFDTVPSVAMLIIGDPLDDPGTVREMEATAERFLAKVAAGDACRLVALPVLPPGASEVALITRHAVARP